MSLFGKKKRDQVQLSKETVVEEKVRRVEKDMAYLEAQIRLFRREQEGVRHA